MITEVTIKDIARELQCGRTLALEAMHRCGMKPKRTTAKGHPRYESSDVEKILEQARGMLHTIRVERRAPSQIELALLPGAQSAAQAIEELKSVVAALAQTVARLGEVKA